MSALRVPSVGLLVNLQTLKQLHASTEKAKKAKRNPPGKVPEKHFEASKSEPIILPFNESIKKK